MNFIYDESVHSWVYRILVVSGCLNFNTLIAENGLFCRVPQIPHDSIYKRGFYSDLELLSFARQSGIACRSTNSFDNPTLYLFDLKGLFWGGGQRGYLHIRYCYECIVKAIEEHGFGYLKASWITDEDCKLHSSTLVEITSSSHERVKFLLGKLLFGTDISKFKIKETKAAENLEVRDNEREVSHYYMPCFMNLFYRWVSFKSKDRLWKHCWVDFYYSDGRRKNVSYNFICNKFIDYCERYPDEISVFFTENYELKEYQFGFEQYFSLKENLIKDKAKNCSKCYRWCHFDICPIKPIALQRIFDLSDDYIEPTENPCELYFKYGPKR